MNNQRLKILLLGGTGAMGIHLSKILNNQGEDVYVTTRRERKGVGITYIQGNAHETAFLSDILRKYHFDAYLVGSDQVWRPIYSYCLSNYFLDFTIGQHVKRIAYAASFGTSKWEFTEGQTTRCAALAKQFDAISVREDSGVVLCKKYLGVDAVHLLDPTMLLNKEDYIRLVEQEQIPSSEKKLMTYILDQSEEKQAIVRKISQTLSLSPNVVMPEKNFAQVGKKDIDQCVFPPVTDWLRGFMDAEYVVTDSFHGTVFSIIFNKPFVASLLLSQI